MRIAVAAFTIGAAALLLCSCGRYKKEPVAVAAASQNEAESVTSALSKLESARADLGNSIINASTNNETEVVKLRASMQQAAAAKAATPPTTTVVDDGPAKTTSTVKRKKKPAPAAPAAVAPAGNTPSPQ